MGKLPVLLLTFSRNAQPTILTVKKVKPLMPFVPSRWYDQPGIESAISRTKGRRFTTTPPRHVPWEQPSLVSRRSSSTNRLTVFVEKQPVAWEVCRVEYWCGKARKQTSSWTWRRDRTEQVLTNGDKPQSINYLRTKIEETTNIKKKVFYQACR